MTQGSILFAGASGLISQDNAQLFFDDTNNTFGFGTTRSGAISGTNAKLVIKGAGATSATSSLEVQDSAGSSKFFVRDDGNVGIGTNTPGTKLEIANESVNVDNVLLNIGDAVHTTNTRDSWIKLFGSQALTDKTFAVGNKYGDLAFTYLGTRATAPSAGTQMVTIQGSSGNVGIGTTTPDYPLQVENSAGSAGISVKTSNTGVAYIFLGDQTSATAGRIEYDNAVPDLSFFVEGAEKVTVLSSGNVGIGTTAPASTLSVAPAAQSGTPGLVGSATSILTNTFTDNATAISGTAANYVANSVAAPTLASTNLTVTTTNAYTNYISGAPIKGTNNTATNAIALGVGAGAVGAQTNSYGLYVNAQTGATNNYVATFMGGRVGIATATPAYLLDIASSGSGVVDTNLRLKNVNSTNNSGAGLALDGYYAGALLRGYTPNAAGFTGGQFDIQVNNDSNVLTTALTINKTGNVGIGTTGPLAKLDVRGLTFGVNHGANVFALSSSGTNYGFIQNDANDVWSLGTGTDLATLGTPVLTWTKAGNVGIGTPSPTSLLHLLGSQPAAVATAGTAATQALQITGGKEETQLAPQDKPQEQVLWLISPLVQVVMPGWFNQRYWRSYHSQGGALVVD